MHVTEITVAAGRTFNHPYESYSNLRPSVTLRATLEPGENYAEAVKTLQAQAEALVEDHKNHLLRSLEELETMKRDQAEAANLAHAIQRAQDRLDEMRGRYPNMPDWLALPHAAADREPTGGPDDGSH